MLRPIFAGGIFHLGGIIRVGVAGAGVFGGFHAAKYAACNAARLTAIFDPDISRASCLAEKFEATVYTDYNSFLLAVDALTIAAPAPCHFDLASRALDAGRHVLIEKPIALSLKDADALIASAQYAKRILQVGHQERFVMEALGLLSLPKRPSHVACRRLGPENGRGEDVSVVFDLMIHDLDLVRKVMNGERVSSINAAVPEGPELAAHRVESMVRFDSGASAAFVAGRRHSSRERTMRLEFDDGFIEIDFLARTIVNTSGILLPRSLDEADAPPALKDPLGYGAERFLEAVNGGELLITGQDGRDALEWAISIEQASRAGAHQRRAAE